jgi:hypothetical protein
MKTIRLNPALSIVTILASLVLSSCYTQLALHDDESASVVDPQSPVVVEPAPAVIVVEPVVLSAGAQYNPLPVATVSVPSVGTQSKSEPPHRDFGTQRSGFRDSGPASSGTRTTGSTRGGR